MRCPGSGNAVVIPILSVKRSRTVLAVAATLFSLALIASALPARAAAPEVKFPVTFTTTLTPGTVYPFSFSIWDARSGGTQVGGWIEGPVKLPVASNKTVYFVLGSKVPLPAMDFAQQYWVEIATGLKKYRARLPAAGYAQWSESVNTAPLDDRYVEEGQEGAVTSAMIGDRQVAAAKVGSETAAGGQVLAADGAGGASWQAIESLPPLAHQHAGEDVASGTMGAARIDAAIARDAEIVPAVLAADGAGSGLDADLLDGQHGAEYASQAAVAQLQASLAELQVLLAQQQVRNEALSTQLVSLRISAGSWGNPQLVETDDSGAHSSAQVSVNAAGNAVAVWRRFDGSRYYVWANRYAAGQGWGAAQLIEADGAGSAGFAQVAVDPAGNAVAVWRRSIGGRYDVWANRYAADTGWGAAQLIETDDTGSAGSVQVAVDPAGNAIAVWHQHDGTRNNVWANRFTADSGWGAAKLIETDAGDALYPQVALDAAGNAVAVWQQSDGTRISVWSNGFAAGPGWGAAELIETDGAGDAELPQVAVDPAGNAVAVWSQSDGTRNNVWANRRAAGSGWGAAQLVETDNAGGASSPQAAMDAAGNAVAVWSQSDGTRNNIWANRCAAGSGWAAAQLIETDAGDASSPQVTVDPTGNAVAVWSQSDGTRSNIWANRGVAGAEWGAAQLIETGAGAASAPQVAVDAAGIAIAVWHQQDATGNSVWANRLR